MGTRLRHGSAVENQASHNSEKGHSRDDSSRPAGWSFRLKSRFVDYKLIVLLATTTSFSMVPNAATAQTMAAEATNKAPSNPAPASPTPMSIDGHPDLTGLWWAYRGVNLDVKQVGNTTINLQPTSRASEADDPEK